MNRHTDGWTDGHGDIPLWLYKTTPIIKQKGYGGEKHKLLLNPKIWGFIYGNVG